MFSCNDQIQKPFLALCQVTPSGVLLQQVTDREEPDVSGEGDGGDVVGDVVVGVLESFCDEQILNGVGPDSVHIYGDDSHLAPQYSSQPHVLNVEIWNSLSHLMITDYSLEIKHNIICRPLCKIRGGCFIL